MKVKVRKNYLLIAIGVLLLIASILSILLFINATQQRVADAKNQTVPHGSNTSSASAIGNTKAYNDIKSIADTKGGKAAWQYVIDTYGKSNEQVNAHDYAHYIGQLIYLKNGIAGMSICTPDFAFGCYHGLLDQAFRKDLSELAEAEQACRQVGAVSSGPYNSCVHGIGHGIASYFKDKDLKAALKTCDLLPGGAPQYCYDGVFMEFASDALDSFYKPNDPLYPCDTLDPQYTYSCGRNQPTVMLNRFHETYEEAIKHCQQAKDINLQTSCYVALGFQAVYLSQNDPQKIITMCETAKDQHFEYQCKSAAAGELVFQNVSNWPTNAPLICNSLPGINQQKMCRDYVSKIQQSYER